MPSLRPIAREAQAENENDASVNGGEILPLLYAGDRDTWEQVDQAHISLQQGWLLSIIGYLLVNPVVLH